MSSHHLYRSSAPPSHFMDRTRTFKIYLTNRLAICRSRIWAIQKKIISITHMQAHPRLIGAMKCPRRSRTYKTYRDRHEYMACARAPVVQEVSSSHGNQNDRFNQCSRTSTVK